MHLPRDTYLCGNPRPCVRVVPRQHRIPSLGALHIDSEMWNVNLSPSRYQSVTNPSRKTASRRLDKRKTNTSSSSRYRWKCGYLVHHPQLQRHAPSPRFTKRAQPNLTSRKIRHLSRPTSPHIQLLHITHPHPRNKPCSHRAKSAHAFQNQPHTPPTIRTAQLL